MKCELIRVVFVTQESDRKKSMMCKKRIARADEDKIRSVESENRQKSREKIPWGERLKANVRRRIEKYREAHRPELAAGSIHQGTGKFGASRRDSFREHDSRLNRFSGLTAPGSELKCRKGQSRDDAFTSSI